VDKYREVLQTISKKVSPPGEKRTKKVHEYVLGQAMEDSAKELPDGTFKKILENCGELNVKWHLVNCSSYKHEKQTKEQPSNQK